MAASRLVVAVGIAAVALAFGVSPAHADDSKERARDHYQQAEAYFKAKQYALAAAEYRASHKLSGHSELLFNIGLSYEKAGSRSQARRFYDRYLERAPSGRRAKEARARRAALGAARASVSSPGRARSRLARGELILRFGSGSGEHAVTVEVGGETRRCERATASVPCQLRGLPGGPASITVAQSDLAPATASFDLLPRANGYDLSARYGESWFHKRRWTNAAIAGGTSVAGIAVLSAGDSTAATLAGTTLLTTAVVAAALSAVGFASQPTFLQLRGLE